MGFWSNITGTTSSFLKIGLTGVRLKNVSGDLEVKNSEDNAYSAVTTSKVSVTGEVIDINSDAAGSGADWKYTIQRPVTGMSAGVVLTLPIDDGSPNQMLVTDGSGNLSWVTATATSMNVAVDTTTIAFGSSSPISAFTLPANAAVHQIDIIIDTPFDGTSPQMSVGVAGTTSKYTGNGDVNLQGTAGDVYSVYPGLVPVGTTEAIIITCAAGSASVGSARVLVFYSVPA